MADPKEKKDGAELLSDAIEAGFGILGYVRFVVANEEAHEDDLKALRRFVNTMDALYDSAEQTSKKKGGKK